MQMKFKEKKTNVYSCRIFYQLLTLIKKIGSKIVNH